MGLPAVIETGRNLYSSALFDDQTVVDIALASVQLESDTAMVCSSEGSGSTMENASVLAVSSFTETNSTEECFSNK